MHADYLTSSPVAHQTFRGFANNVYKICYGTIPALSIVLALQPTAGAQLFFTLFINWWMLSQEIHKYSHMKKPPRFVKALQDWGFIVSRKEHGLHHSSPYEGHYCILTGQWNWNSCHVISFHFPSNLFASLCHDTTIRGLQPSFGQHKLLPSS